MEHRDNRVSALDGLRGIAILLVLGYHYFSEVDALKAAIYPYGDTFSKPFTYGFLGVQLFFITSGFVIAMTLEKCQTPTEFFIRRFARIWPALFVCSLATFAIVKLFPSPFSDLRTYGWVDFLPSLTLTPNGIWSGYFPRVDLVDGVYWSLLIEARFYVIVAVIYWMFAGANLARNLAIFTILNILCRAALQRIIPGSNVIYTAVLVPDFMPWFTAGAVFYEMFNRRIRASYAVAMLVPMIAIIFRSNTFDAAKGYSQLILDCFDIVFFAIFFVVALRLRAATIFEARALVFVGACSYSIYLLHNAIGMTILTLIPAGLPVMAYPAIVGLVATIMIMAGYLCYVWVETPFRKMAHWKVPYLQPDPWKQI